MKFEYTKYIQDVQEFDFDHINLLAKNIVVPAMKESGKSTTIRYLLYKLRHQIKDIFVFCGSEEEDPFYTKITDSEVYTTVDAGLLLTIYEKEVEKKKAFDKAYEKVQEIFKDEEPLGVKRRLKHLKEGYENAVKYITSKKKLYALQSAERIYERKKLEVFQEFIRNYVRMEGEKLSDKEVEELSYIYKPPCSFVVFDDIFREAAEWRGDKAVQEMIRKFRHVNGGMIFAIHNITDIPPAFRNNADVIITVPTVAGILESTFKYLLKSMYMKQIVFEETVGYYSSLPNKWGTSNALVTIMCGRSPNRMDHVFYMPIKKDVEAFKVGRKKKKKH